MKIVASRELNRPFLIFLMESFRLGFVSSDALSSSAYSQYPIVADLYSLFSFFVFKHFPRILAFIRLIDTIPKSRVGLYFIPKML